MKFSWSPPKHWKCIETIDAHTAGEPLRIFTNGLPEIKGESILEQRSYFKQHYDHLRTSCMFEPRGHADMYGAVLTESKTVDGDFGVFFIHNEGYSTMCGHAIIALSKILPEIGIIQKEGDEFQLKIDTPAGRILSTINRKNGKVDSVKFQNVASFVYLKEVEFGGFKAVIPEVSGTAYITGQHKFYIDPDDPLKDGFIFR